MDTLTLPARKVKAAPRTTDITSERIVVTPEIAQAWLDKNISNRKLIVAHVSNLARDMKAGAWDFTGEAIKFDTNRNLLDGQHRLHACVKSGVAFETLVIYNLPPETQKKMDGGRARTAGDILSMAGVNYATTISGVCRIVLSEKNGSRSVHGGSYTTTELLETADRHRLIAASARMVRSKKLPPGVPGVQVTFLHYVASFLLDRPEQANAFLAVLHSGVPSYEGDPAHAFRERVLRTTSSSTKIDRTLRYNMLKHAWNLFNEGKSVMLLRPPNEVDIKGLNKSDL